MTQINVEEIKRGINKYLHRVQAGETLVVEEAGQQIIEIRPFVGAVNNQKINKQRPAGLCEGEFVVPDDFNEPLPENIIEEFEGS